MRALCVALDGKPLLGFW